MFDIEYKGGNTVVIASKKVTIVVDPNQKVIGLKDIVVKDAIQLATEQRLLVDSPSYSHSFEGPGEYETGDVSIRGVAAIRHIDEPLSVPASTVYRIDIGGIRVAVIGNIAPKLSEDQLEEIGVVDVVILPVGGGGYTLDATSATTLVRQLEPSVVIPVHYSDKVISYEVPQDTLDTFTQELGAPVETVTKYKVKSQSSLPATLTTIVVERS